MKSLWSRRNNNLPGVLALVHRFTCRYRSSKGLACRSTRQTSSCSLRAQWQHTFSFLRTKMNLLSLRISWKKAGLSPSSSRSTTHLKGLISGSIFKRSWHHPLPFTPISQVHGNCWQWNLRLRGKTSTKSCSRNTHIPALSNRPGSSSSFHFQATAASSQSSSVRSCPT